VALDAERERALEVLHGDGRLSLGGRDAAEELLAIRVVVAARLDDERGEHGGRACHVVGLEQLPGSIERHARMIS
jgi:hypothetical protein